MPRRENPGEPQVTRACYAIRAENLQLTYVMQAPPLVDAITEQLRRPWPDYRDIGSLLNAAHVLLPGLDGVGYLPWRTRTDTSGAM